MGVNGQLRPEQLPRFTVATIRVPQGDGSVLLRPGKPVLAEEMISTSAAAKILGLSQRTIQYECEVGLFATAFRPGGKRGSFWRIARAEVLARCQRRERP